MSCVCVITMNDDSDSGVRCVTVREERRNIHRVGGDFVSAILGWMDECCQITNLSPHSFLFTNLSSIHHPSFLIFTNMHLL